jgi:hypothetical protein
MHVKTRDNVNFEKPLDKQISCRVTTDEYSDICSIAKSNGISEAELIRNILRENIFKYVSSEDVKKTLQIKGQIDKILLNRRLISRTFESNYSKTHEIMTIFEEDLEVQSKNIDLTSVKSRLMELVYLTKLIYEVDEFLSKRIEPQWKRILKNKLVKPLIKDIVI